MCSGGDVKKLPSVPPQVGGDVDFKIGIKYLRYFPQIIFQMPSGLTIYNSNFLNSDGSTGVIGGSHKVFSDIMKFCKQPTNFIRSQFKMFQLGYLIYNLRLLGYINDEFNKSDLLNDESSPHCNEITKFQQVGLLGLIYPFDV